MTEKNKGNDGKEHGSKELRDMETVIKRPVESLEESLKEMKLIRAGKLKKKTWKELREELKKEEKGN